MRGSSNVISSTVDNQDLGMAGGDVSSLGRCGRMIEE